MMMTLTMKHSSLNCVKSMNVTCNACCQIVDVHRIFRHKVCSSQEIIVMSRPNLQLYTLLQLGVKQGSVGPCLELNFVRVVYYWRLVPSFLADLVPLMKFDL